MFNHFDLLLDDLLNRIVFVEQYPNNKKLFSNTLTEMYKKNKDLTIQLLESIVELFVIEDQKYKQETKTNTTFLHNIILTSDAKELYMDVCKTLLVKYKHFNND
jgi:hypothetical protein